MSKPTVKEIKLVFTPDERSLAGVKNDLKDLSKLVNLTEAEKETIEKTKSIQNELSKLQSLLSKYKDVNDETAKKIRDALTKQIAEYEDALGIATKKEQEKKDPEEQERLDKELEARQEISDIAIGKLKNIADEFVGKVKDVFKAGWEEFSKVLGSYSRLSNDNTRELAFTYGFSSSQAYGFDRAMSVLGFQSEEDLFYANSQEIELFRTAFTKYSDKYEKLYDKGTFEQLLEYQVEIAEFEQDLKLEVADFFMQNKDVIKAGLQAIMTIAEVITKIASFMFGTYKTSNKTAAISDVISNYSNNRTINVSMQNTYNGIDTTRQSNFNLLGAATVESIIAGIKGGKV